MDVAAARDRIARMTAAAYEPVLTPAELDDLVELAKRPDVDGLAPDDDNWTETWDINAAAAAGWNWKAGKASSDFNYRDDAGSYDRESVFDMCKRQEADYRKRCHGTIYLARDDLPWERVTP